MNPNLNLSIYLETEVRIDLLILTSHFEVNFN